MFSEHVDVTYVSLPTNRETGTIKGFAFVDVASEDQIPIAVEKLNQFEMEGRALRVSRSLPKDQIRSTKKTCKCRKFCQSLVKIQSIESLLSLSFFQSKMAKNYTLEMLPLPAREAS